MGLRRRRQAETPGHGLASWTVCLAVPAEASSLPSGGRVSTSRRKRRRRAAAPRGTCRARACSGTCGAWVGLTLCADASATHRGPRCTHGRSSHCALEPALQEAGLPSVRRPNSQSGIPFSAFVVHFQSGCPESRINEVRILYTTSVPLSHTTFYQPQIPI